MSSTFSFPSSPPHLNRSGTSLVRAARAATGALFVAAILMGCDTDADVDVDVTAPSTIDNDNPATGDSVINVNPGSVSNQAPGSEIGTVAP